MTDPLWPPAITAMDHPEGHRQRGSTGQLFEVRNMQWIRVPEPEERKMVRVACYQTGGLMLKLFKRGDDDGTGFRPNVADGPGIRLNGSATLTSGGVGNVESSNDAPGITEVDAEWWGKWVAQNEGKNALYDQGLIRLVQEETSAENPTQ